MRFLFFDRLKSKLKAFSKFAKRSFGLFLNIMQPFVSLEFQTGCVIVIRMVEFRITVVTLLIYNRNYSLIQLP